MKLLLVFGLVLFLGALVFLVLLKKRGTSGLPDTWPFYSKKPLSDPEQVLFHRMVKALPECVVLSQVQLSRVLGVKKGENFGQWHNRINRMSLDYLICLKDFTVVAAVELDDSSHNSPARREADSKKQKALESAGVSLIRWHVSSMPDEAVIRAAFLK